MAFELAELNPTSVPINLLNPRDGTKFGDRPLMDAWEVVKWVAIFRLIIPGALFRLCGGRVENLADLQPLAVKAGLNGVMMGNFLTTLGAEPEDDRAMFEELGLNVARQEDNGANPRPDNRSGWLDGRDAGDADRRADRPPGRGRLLGSRRPSCGSSRRRRSRRRTRAGAASTAAMTDVAERLEELRDRGLRRRLRLVDGPQGPRVMLDGKEVLLLCSNDYLGLADHPACARAAAAAAERWGAGAGASRLISGNMAPHRRARAAPRGVQGPRGGAALRLGLPRQHRHDPGARAGRAASSSPTSSTTPASSTAAGWPRAETFVYRHARRRAPRLGPAQGAAAAPR